MWGIIVYHICIVLFYIMDEKTPDYMQCIHIYECVCMYSHMNKYLSVCVCICVHRGSKRLA